MTQALRSPFVGPRAPAGLAAVALALVTAGFRAPQHAQDGKRDAVTPKEAGELFAARCAACHVAPDVAFATDRAWLDQIEETA
jgi:mono/diheme cytochrome c family protein